MFCKFYLFLFICFFSFQASCQTNQATENIATNNNQQKADSPISDDEIQQLFIDSGLGEGDGNLEKLMALPKERVIAVVQKLKDKGISKGERGYQTEYQSEPLKLKSAYFLWTLDIDKASNEKFIIEATKNKDNSKKFDAMTWLENIVSEGKKEYTPIVLKAAPLANGAFATEMHGFAVGELEDSPKIFLLYFSKESSEVKESIYSLVSYTEEMFGKESFEKIKSNLEKMKSDAEVKSIAEEFLREINKKQ